MMVGERGHTPKALNLSYRCIVVSYYALLCLFLIKSLTTFEKFSLAMPVTWLLQSTPLLGFCRGIHKKNTKQFIWLSLVVLLYFMHGVLVAFDPARRIAGAAELGLSVLLFCTLLLYLRLSQKINVQSVTSP